MSVKKKEFDEKEFIKFLRSEGIIVKTSTKARGHLGICFKNRIDISKNADFKRRLGILAHEYAHKIHFDIEKDGVKKGGSLEILFNTADTKIYFTELIEVTCFVDENAKFLSYEKRKQELKCEVSHLEKVIRIYYPDFKKTEQFKPVKDYFRKNNTPAKHLLKYDNVKILTPFLKKEETYSVKNIDNDFPKIPEPIRAYIKLNSKTKEYKRLYSRKNKAERYYKKPTELFARLVEGFFTDKERIAEMAPQSSKKFFELLDMGYYGRLKELFILAEKI